MGSIWGLPIGIPGNLVVNADINYQSKRYTTEDGHWTAAVSARNLTNKQYAYNPGYTVDGNSGAARLPAWRTANFNDPRTVLFTVTYKR